jgi:ankyrin repeat protein
MSSNNANQTAENIFMRFEKDKNFRLSEVENINNLLDDDQTLLQYAIVWRADKVPELLTVPDLDLDHQDNKGFTALQYALARDYHDIAVALIEKGANLNTVDRYGNGPLWTAALQPKKNYDIIRLMVSKGADPHHVNKAGRSPLSFAKENNKEELIEALKK